MKQSKQPQDAQQSILIALITASVLLALFIFRSYDDNRLTSWSWVFAEFSAIKFFIMVTLGVLISYPLSRVILSLKLSIFGLSITSFFITVLFWKQPEVIVDASRYFMQAKYVELNGPGYFLEQWGKAIPAWTDMPLVPFIYGGIFYIFGETRGGVQFFTSLLFTATVVLTYLIGRTLWHKQLGLYAAALLLAIPYLNTQVPLLMVDVAAMFFLTLSIYSVIKAIESENTMLFLWSSVTITLALLVKYSNGLMMSVIPLIFLAYTYKGWNFIIRQGLIVTVGIIILFGTFLLLKFDVFLEQLHLLQTYQLPALNRWKESLVSTFLFQIHPVITIAAIYSLYRALKAKDIKYLIICWLVLLILLLDIRRIRYLIAVFPMLTLMGAYGLYYLKSEKVRNYLVSSTVVTATLIAIIAYLPFLQHTSSSNIQQAGEYLNTIDIDVDSLDVYVENQIRSSVNPAVAVPILDLFTEKELTYLTSGSALNAPGNINKLPLRWTWELDTTQYLSEKSNKEQNDDRTVVVIQSRVNQPLSEFISKKIKNHHLRKEFKVSDSVFKYQTTVKIFQRNDQVNIEEAN